MMMDVALLLLAVSAFSQGALITIDVAQEYGINEKGIAAAVTTAKAHLVGAPNDQLNLFFKEGNWTIDQTTDGFFLSGVNPGIGGRLIISGAGMNKTTILFTNRHKDTIRGFNVSRLTVRDIHFSRSYQTVSQGDIVSVQPGNVTVDLHPGFPTPAELFDPCMTHGRFLREYTQDKLNPHVVTPSPFNNSLWPPTTNDQVSYADANEVYPGRWVFDLHTDIVANFTIGGVAAIKSKQCAQAYQFFGADDVTFERVKWTKISRGIFRGAVNNIQILNTMISRSEPVNGRVPCIATYGGGPQITGSDTGRLTNVVVDGHIADGTGDDSVAIFDATQNITVKNCYICDSFARGILLVNSSSTVLTDNIVERCPVYHVRGCCSVVGPPCANCA